MGSLLARLNRLEKAMTPKDGDVQVISALMDELAGNAPSGAYQKVIERRQCVVITSSVIRTQSVAGGW